MNSLRISDFSIRSIAYPLNLTWAEDAPDISSVTAADQKIRSFKTLPSGWHYGEGIAPSQARIDSARDWLNRLAESGFVATDAFPGVSGEIMISARHGSEDIEIVLEIDDTISFFYDRNDETISSIEHGSAADVEVALAKVGDQWSTLGFSISDISQLIRIDSTDWRFGITETAHPLFSKSALIFPARSARTSGTTIQTLPENPQYFGFWTDPLKIEKHRFQLMQK